MFMYWRRTMMDRVLLGMEDRGRGRGETEQRGPGKEAGWRGGRTGAKLRWRGGMKEEATERSGNGAEGYGAERGYTL